MSEPKSVGEILDLMARIAIRHPDRSPACAAIAAAYQAAANDPPWMPRAQPGELGQSPCGWYWRPHPDDLRKHVEIVWACSRCTPDPGTAPFRSGNYRALLQAEPGALYECYRCGRTWTAGEQK